MKASILLFLTLIVINHSTLSQNVTYTLRMENPESHYFQVEMEIENWKKNDLNLHMPVWAPGSYLVREFAKNVNLVKATNAEGENLLVQKTSKNIWKINTQKSSKITVKYEVYAFELSVRTSFLDFTHGFVSGSGVFMFLEGALDKPGTLIVEPHSYFKKVATALPTASENLSSDGTFRFKFENYDHLVDCPIEIGNHEEFSFDAAGVNHKVVLYGEGNYNVERLKEDMGIVVTNATKVFGENPNKDYLFIIHNVTNAQGGLEHSNSTTLSVNRWTYQGSQYLGFLSLVAHEYFHLWNVKRIRPIELGPFNYDAENYTSLLWVMEGFTSYYDELLMLRSGFYTQEQFLQKLNSSINYVEGSLGSRVQPLAHSSYDAWIKAYRPNENSGNTTMTYYSRGQLMASIFDAMIVYESKGQHCLDDFLQALYQKFHLGLDRGFTETEFKNELEKWTKQDLSEFWTNYILSTQIPDYQVYFQRAGVMVERKDEKRSNFGASMSNSGNLVIVNNVRTNSAAEKAGIAPGDEIISINGFRVNTGEIEELVQNISTGDMFKVLFARDKVMFEAEVVMENYSVPKFSLSPSTSSMEKMLRDYWLR